MQAREFAKIRQEVGDKEKTQPKEAIARYKAFWEQHSELDPAVSADISVRIARLYHTRVKDSQAALDICDWAIANDKTSAGRIRPAVYKTQILVDLLRTDEAQVWAEKTGHLP